MTTQANVAAKSNVIMTNAPDAMIRVGARTLTHRVPAKGFVPSKAWINTHYEVYENGVHIGRVNLGGKPGAPATLITAQRLSYNAKLFRMSFDSIEAAVAAI